MPIRFASAVSYNAATVLDPDAGSGVDRRYLTRYVRALEDGGFDFALLGYGSGSADPFTIAGTIGGFTERIRPTIALRPNIVHPTMAAKALATLDRLTDGRAVVHVISGGSTADQAREGDFLGKDDRYERTDEYIRILRRIWREDGPIDHDGKYYRFHDFRAAVRPVGRSVTVSFAGSSPAAYRVGGELADIYALWAEPVERTREQIARVQRAAVDAGREDRPDIWLSLRPIIAETKDLAWAKAFAIRDALLERGRGARTPDGLRQSVAAVENSGSQRLVEVAAQGERLDRALWTPLVSAEGPSGASVAVVGTAETVARQILDFVDAGVSIFAMRGYDNLNDVIDYGREIIPLVHRLDAERHSASSLVGVAG